MSAPLRSLLALAALVPQAPTQDPPATPAEEGLRAPPALVAAGERVHRLVSSMKGDSFHSVVAPDEVARPEFPREVPVVGVTTPWGPEERLWIQVPEHTWTHLASSPEQRCRLFSGMDPSRLRDDWRRMPFPLRAPAAWERDEERGLVLDVALEGGVRLAYEVLPGERCFEIRLGIRNGSGQALLGTWPQFCTVLGECASLAAQSAQSFRLPAGGALIDWGGAGQDLAWIERARDASGRIRAARYLLALVEGRTDERHDPESPAAPDTMWLARPLDLPLVVKSSPDGKRHLVLYSPMGRTVLCNLFMPCAHVDPYLPRIEPGETRWGVLYGVFHDGDVAPVVEAFRKLDRVLRCPEGFPGD